MRGFTFVLAVSFFVPTTAVSAQQPPPVEIGQRIRVSQCHTELFRSGFRDVCERSVGTLATLSATTVTLRVVSRGTELAFPMDSVTQIDVHRGWGMSGRNVLRGAGVGLLAGGAVGAGIAIAMYGTDGCITGYDDEIPCGFIGAGVGAGSGLLLGAMIGVLIWTDRWEEVPLDRLRVSFAPRRDGFALRFAIAF
ncbi:hypothetical protein ACFL3B_00510 [Gemmatimonadota bacterium]